jgi:hypothetical protein
MKIYSRPSTTDSYSFQTDYTISGKAMGTTFSIIKKAVKDKLSYASQIEQTNRINLTAIVNSYFISYSITNETKPKIITEIICAIIRSIQLKLYDEKAEKRYNNISKQYIPTISIQLRTEDNGIKSIETKFDSMVLCSISEFPIDNINIKT